MTDNSNQLKDWVEEQVVARDVRDARVLTAMRNVPRHLFVPKEFRERAYEDRPFPIGPQQTISQPFIVAYMTEMARLQPADRVLEVGTGSGYQAAVLAEIVREVFSIEFVERLGVAAEATLKGLGYKNISCRIGNGYLGWPDAAPFDAIIVTAAPPKVPQELLAQLREGGRLIVPVGRQYQELLRITKTAEGLKEERLIPVSFVEMVHSGKT